MRNGQSHLGCRAELEKPQKSTVKSCLTRESATVQRRLDQTCESRGNKTFLVQGSPAVQRDLGSHREDTLWRLSSHCGDHRGVFDHRIGHIPDEGLRKHQRRQRRIIKGPDTCASASEEPDTCSADGGRRDVFLFNFGTATNVWFDGLRGISLRAGVPCS